MCFHVFIGLNKSLVFVILFQMENIAVFPETELRDVFIFGYKVFKVLVLRQERGYRTMEDKVNIGREHYLSLGPI